MMSERSPEADYQIVVLSPHFDDAVFSCGGYLHQQARQGQRILVANVFTAEPPAVAESQGYIAKLHRDWRRDGDFEGPVMQHRQGEDDKACRLLGVDNRSLGFLDAVYRVDGAGLPLYPTPKSIRRGRHLADEELIDRLVESFRKLPQEAQWIVPIGVGRHIDHVMVRRAARFVQAEGSLLYEDFPYAEKAHVAFRARMQTRKGRRWKNAFESLSEDDLEAKLKAIDCYCSQLAPLGENWRKKVRRFSRRSFPWRFWQPCERLWTLS